MAKEKWIRYRHRVVTEIARLILTPYSVLKYGVKIEKFKEQKGRQYLVLFNHQTAFDQFFVGMAFKGPIYYLASEDLFSKGWISSVIRYIIAPIPIKKQTTDIGAIKNCMRVAKEGGTIALAPEGNRTFRGKTEYMNPSIASLAKKLGLPIALFRIEGGYGVHPRWSDVVRKGKMKGYVSQVIEPEDYKELSNEQLFDIIEKGLFVDEVNADNIFNHQKRAEFLERVFYVCPYCGLAEFETYGHHIECKKCGKIISFEPTTELVGIGHKFPFKFVSDWYDYQQDFINSLDLTEFTTSPLFKDKVQLSEVIVYKNKNILLENAEISLFGDKFVIYDGKENKITFPFEDTLAVTILGKNKLNIYFDRKIYQLKGSKRFNALKYLNIYNRYINISRGVLNGKFLGL